MIRRLFARAHVVRWFFGTVDEDIHLIAQAEDPGGGMGVFRVIHPGEEFYDMPYQELKAAGSGAVIVEHDGRARIE